MEATFGELLRTYRLALGLSQEALAERCGLSTLEISHLEHGRRRGPRRATVAALAAALGLSSDQAAALEGSARRRRRPRPAPPPHPPGLPRLQTPILGRATDLEVLPFLLGQADARLLTLVGPAGVGKTRLALEVAARLAAAFPDGLTWVDLAPLRDAGLVAPTLVARLGLRGDAASDRELLLAHLRARGTLLVLDNLEQMLPAAPLLQELLDTCPRLRILATSRIRLGLRGERPYALTPLTLPPPGEDDPRRVEEYAAVALFLERARVVVPGLTLTASTAAAVAEVCRRLDGLPLAIELAAALARLVPPQAMLARLGWGELSPPEAGAAAGVRPGRAIGATLDLLGSGSWERPERQQTMRQALAWSYDLLTPEGQALFRRLAVFVGGFMPEAASAVGRRGGERDVWEGVGELVSHSLLRVDGPLAGDSRLLMLETIREYGLEQLEAHDEAEEARRDHAAHYLALAEEAQPEMQGPEQATWIGRLEREHDNLLAALRWTQARGQAETALRLAAALGRFWLMRGYLTEGRAWLDGALATDLPPTASAAAWAQRCRWEAQGWTG
jgi:predicted ATPase